MRKLAAFALSFFLMTGVALADTPPKDADAKAAEPAPKPKAARKAPAADPAAIAAEVEELRKALEAQQEQIQMLKEELARRELESQRGNFGNRRSEKRGGRGRGFQGSGRRPQHARCQDRKGHGLRHEGDQGAQQPEVQRRSPAAL